MMQPKQARIEYLDTIKGFSILLVVFCHYPTLSDSTVTGAFFMTLAWLGVPCFMMVSGALMHQKKSFSFKKHLYKMLRLYFVLVIWKIIYLILSALTVGVQYNGIRQIIEYLFLFKTIDGVNTGHIWYIQAFLIALFLFPISWFLFHIKSTGNVTGKKLFGFLIIISGISGILLPSITVFIGLLQKIFPAFSLDISGFVMIFPFTNYGNMIFYFLLGALIFENQDLILKYIKRPKAILVTVFLVSAFGLMFVRYTDMGSFAWNGIYLTGGYTRLLTMFMSVSVFLLTIELGKKPMVVSHFLAKYIGQNTMGIYYMHVPFLLLCNKYIYPDFYSYYSCWLNWVKTIVITAVCILITVLLKKIPIVRKLVE